MILLNMMELLFLLYFHRRTIKIKRIHNKIDSHHCSQAFNALNNAETWFDPLIFWLYYSMPICEFQNKRSNFPGAGTYAGRAAQKLMKTGGRWLPKLFG